MGRESSKHRRSKKDDSTDEDNEDESKHHGHKKRSSSHSSNRRGSKRSRDSSDDDPSGSHTESDEPDRRGRPTPDNQEMMEYLAKKAYKKALKVSRKLKAQVPGGYSNDSNPFGDSNLTEKFIWKKKIERDLAQNVTPTEVSLKAEKKRQKERLAEIEKVKKRREERAIEKARHEEEMAMLARERARAEYQDWEKKEEEFHFQQSKVRSEIRLKDGRAKPIDILSKNLNLSDDFDVEINEPYKIYKGLTVKEMEELRQDIKMHLDLDRETPTHIEFWEAMMVVCDWEISEARKRDALDRARVRGEEPPPELLAEERGLHGSVEGEVKTLLHGKSFNELRVLEENIELEMKSGRAKVVEYWEAVLKRLHIYKAKARLKEIHADLLRQHLNRFKEMEEDVHSPYEEDMANREVDQSSEELEELPSHSPEVAAVEDGDFVEDEPGSFSPELVHTFEGDAVVDPETDKADLDRKRAEVLEEQQRRLQEAAAGSAVGDDDNAELTMHERELAMKAMGGMDDGDAILGSGAEVNLESQVYWWHDKYRPRKPKYFNRVHTGYEWNKYNQTHYDHDNPPPKIVQGYKFNIFYPDLVDKTRAPVYHIEKDGSNGETCLIRFNAGPPYEDIAFRIVNKEWEYSHKKGFKCTFERGILHVYFNFKRYRYRR